MPAPLELGDPLAHRALAALVRAETTVRRALAQELERDGVSAAGFAGLVVLTTAGGSLELRTLRRHLEWSKAGATEVTLTLEARGLVRRRRLEHDRRAAVIELTPVGHDLVQLLFPNHAERVASTFAPLDAAEKRSQRGRRQRPAGQACGPRPRHAQGRQDRLPAADR